MTQSLAENSSRRLPELDILRGLAIVLVLGPHVGDIPHYVPTWSRSAFLVWREIGWTGVDLFFVLSGFLVSGLLFSEYQNTGTIRIGRFLIRRAFKLYPSFYVFLVVSLASAYLWGFPAPFVPWRFAGESLFLQNYIGSYWAHTWSLAVEEHFYLMLALLAAFLTRFHGEDHDPFRHLPLMVFVSAVAVLLLRFVRVYQHHDAPGDWVVFRSHFRIDSLFFGVLLGYLHAFKPGLLEQWTRRFAPVLVAVALLAVVAPLLFPLNVSPLMFTFGLTLLYFAYGSILLLALFYSFEGKSRWIERLRPLASIGRTSYSTYLWHMMVYFLSLRLWALARPTPMAFYAQVACYILGSLLVGTTMADLLELPVLRIRDRLFPRSTLGPTAVQMRLDDGKSQPSVPNAATTRSAS